MSNREIYIAPHQWAGLIIMAMSNTVLEALAVNHKWDTCDGPLAARDISTSHIENILACIKGLSGSYSELSHAEWREIFNYELRRRAILLEVELDNLRLELHDLETDMACLEEKRLHLKAKISRINRRSKVYSGPTVPSGYCDKEGNDLYLIS